MDPSIPEQFDLYYIFEHQSMVPQGNEGGISQTYLPRQPPAGRMEEAEQHPPENLSMHTSLRNHHHHQHHNLYQSLRTIPPHPYYAISNASIPSQMYISDVESSPSVILSTSSAYRLETSPSGASSDISRHLFVDAVEHGSYDTQNTTLPHREAHTEEILVRREPEADRGLYSANQYTDEAYGAQEPPRRFGPTKAGRKKRQETDDELSEVENSDSRKTSSDITRQRGRPRLESRDESQAERRRTQIRLAQRAYRLRKENTIASLRSRVSELESAMEGMQDAFAELHHAATTIAQEHAVNDQSLTTFLDSITERFYALAKTASMRSVEGSISCDEDPDVYISGEEMFSSSRRLGSSQTRG